VNELSIRSLQDGGFVVAQVYRGNGCMEPCLFACTTIDEALKYVKRNLIDITKEAQRA
jgi:hypothetical protein